MSMTSKYRLGDDQLKAPRQFVDREELIRVFTEAIPELPPDDYRLLVYYGIGGIGKTRLRNELCRLLKEQYSKVVFATLDFAVTSHRNVETALFWLRRELRQKCKGPIPFLRSGVCHRYVIIEKSGDGTGLSHRQLKQQNSIMRYCFAGFPTTERKLS